MEDDDSVESPNWAQIRHGVADLHKRDGCNRPGLSLSAGIACDWRFLTVGGYRGSGTIVERALFLIHVPER